MLTDNNENYFWDSFWGLLITLCISFLIFVSFSLLQSVFIVTYGFYLEGWNPNTNIDQILASLAYNGDAISIAEIPSALFGIALIFLFTRLRQPISVTAYLQLSPTKLSALLKWLGVMLLIILLMEFSYTLLNRNTPDFMTKIYQSTTNYPLLWLAIIIAAPFFEELLFRGYLLEGIKKTPLGVLGAIIIPAASWAIIHIQYATLEIFTIFLIGVVFGIAKIKTGSLYVPIAMHMLMNLTASVSMEIR